MLDPSSLVTGTVNWSMCIGYYRPDRTDCINLSASLDASTAWAITDTTSDWGGCSGGKVVVTNDRTDDEFVFYIRGTNTDTDTIKAYIDSVNSYFYAEAIAAVESGFLQFNTAGSLGPTPDTGGSWSANVQACPNRGSSSPYGWGIYQLTTADFTITPDMLWDWTANVNAAKAIMDSKNSAATAWINSQKAIATKPLSSAVFTWGGISFQEGTARTPIDACAIQYYNGLGSPPRWVVYWDKPSRTWRQRANAYLTSVCNNL
jgi:hypothetical protein